MKSYEAPEPQSVENEVAGKVRQAKQMENQKGFQRQGMSERDAVLHSMKQSKQEQKAETEPVKTSRDEYPYGMRVHVEGPHVKKLGLHTAKVGDHVKLHAKAKVMLISQSQHDGEEPSHRAELQITHMGVHGTNPDSSEDLDGEEQD